MIFIIFEMPVTLTYASRIFGFPQHVTEYIDRNIAEYTDQCAIVDCGINCLGYLILSESYPTAALKIFCRIYVVDSNSIIEQ